MEEQAHITRQVYDLATIVIYKVEALIKTNKAHVTNHFRFHAYVPKATLQHQFTSS